MEDTTRSTMMAVPLSLNSLLERAGRLLQENGPMLRASVRFVTSGVIGVAVRRVFSRTLPTDFYPA